MSALLHDCHSMLPAFGEATASVAPASELPPSEAGALIDIPFLPFPIEPFGRPARYEINRSEDIGAWETRDGAKTPQKGANTP